jgi:FixJ family two-component response regulator
MNALKDMQDKAIVRIVDDDSDLSSALKFFIELDGWHTAVYNDARSFLAADLPSVPGCLVLDVRMPGMTGIELQRELDVRGIDLPIIFLSAHGDIEMAVKAVQNGAVDFLVKPPEPGKLLEIVRKTVLEHQRKRKEDGERAQLLAQYETLTPTERQILFLIAKGFTNATIGEVQEISEKTAKGHRARIYGKLDLENAVEASEFLRHAGLTEGGGR